MTIDYRAAGPADQPFVEEMLGWALGWREGACCLCDDIPEVALAVQPDARRRGVASGLLTRLPEEVSARRFPGVSLSVNSDNFARRLYERFGFVQVGEVTGVWTMLRSFER